MNVNRVLQTSISPLESFNGWSGAMLNVFDSIDSLSSLTFPLRNNDLLSIVCISGSVSLDYDTHCLTLKEKQMLVLLPGHIIEHYTTSPDFKGFMIVSSLVNFESFLPLMSRLHVCSIHFKDNPVVSLTDEEFQTQILFHDLLKKKLSKDGGVFSNLIINKLCEGIFCETLNIYFNRVDRGAFEKQCRRSEALLYRFILLVEANFINERSVAFYADRLCVTPKHLSAAVKEISGRTASDWIEQYVVDEIKRLLATTEMTIQEISVKMRFANQSFFGKYFKNHTGMSPRKFRSRLFK